MEDGTYIVMIDGSVRWEPCEEDIEAWREEAEDLTYDPDSC